MTCSLSINEVNLVDSVVQIMYKLTYFLPPFSLSFVVKCGILQLCLWIYFFFKLLLSTIVSIFLPPLSSTGPSILLPLALSMGPLYRVLDDPSPSFLVITLFPSLWLLSVCSFFQCLWLYFACLFVLLIRFHL